MRRDFLGRVEVLGHERWGDRLGRTSIDKTFSGRPIDGKFTRWVERIYAREIADGVVVLFIIQSPEYDGPGIAGQRFRFPR